MPALPTGTVTFLFTDIEGSTRLLEASPEAYRAALGRHDITIRQAATSYDGVISQTRGDGLCVAFANPIQATQAALTAQQALWIASWGDAGVIKARMALHTGAVELQGGEYVGATLHRGARLIESAHGGQIILSAATAALVDEALPPGAWLTDLGEHRLRDLARTERLFQLNGLELRTEFPPLRTLTAVPNNLPSQATAFIGRQQQITTVSEMLLGPTSRLLTLTGPGGTGKTRLSLQVAGEVVDSFPDGVYFVALASIADPDLVPSAIAQALNIRETLSRSLVSTLASFLRQKRFLLILDNFEQVIEAAPIVAELLSAASSLKIVTTSRAPLHIYGEREYSVLPLALPDQRALASAAHLAQFEAVRLFVDRAQAARPDFVLDDENAADVSEICHRLDGLPLAIELAAARVRALPPVALLQRMERRLPLLTGGARDMPARQRTLRDAIAWSYDLLEPNEQGLFRRLAVFRGCTLDAAEAVCAGEPPQPGARSVALSPLDLDVLDGIESLVEKNLLRQDRTADGQPWYLMLETIREFAFELLHSTSEADVVHRRHALASIRLAEQAEAELNGSRQVIWFARLEQEHDNLRAALGWSEAHGYAIPALRLAVALWWFWSARGHVREGRERLTGLLTRFPLTGLASPDRREVDNSRAGLQARAYYAAGMLASMEADHGAARTWHEAGLALRRSIGDERGVFNALEGLGTIMGLQGDYVAARVYFEEALGLARSWGDREATAMILHAIGNVSAELGDLDVARAYHEETARTLPVGSPLKGHMISLAAIALEQGRYDDAEMLAVDALSWFRAQSNSHVQALLLATLGGVALARGDQVTARQHLCASISNLHELRHVPGVAQVLERFVGLAAAQGRFEGALRLAGAAFSLSERGGGPLSPRSRSRLDQALEPARRALPDVAIDAALREGRLLDLDQAVAAALTITELGATNSNPRVASSPDNATSRSGQASLLSRREQQVAGLIAQGLTNRQIADQLVITEGTAANHVNHILSKLGFGSRTQVAVWASEQGLA